MFSILFNTQRWYPINFSRYSAWNFYANVVLWQTANSFWHMTHKSYWRNITDFKILLWSLLCNSNFQCQYLYSLSGTRSFLHFPNTLSSMTFKFPCLGSVTAFWIEFVPFTLLELEFSAQCTVQRTLDLNGQPLLRTCGWLLWMPGFLSIKMCINYRQLSAPKG
jgi:hypothetical protein